MHTHRFDRTPFSRPARAIYGIARNRSTIRALALVAFITLLALPGVAADMANDRQEGLSKVQDAAKVVQEIMGAKDRALPDELLEDAVCVAVFPNVIKGAFIVGGSGGHGCAVARDPKTGRYGLPLFLKIGSGSIGFQIGGSSTDFLLVGLNGRAQDSLAQGEWTLGADAAVAGGPVGRSAKAGTDWKLDAQFLSYSRSKGAFAGVALDGSKITIDRGRNSAIYGPAATPEQILSGKAKPDPRLEQRLMALANTLARYTPPKRHSSR